MGEFKYRAFISYSWADAKWGKWLHHQLETYRTPAALVRKGAPARLNPIFKDREEEAAGSSIGDAVEKGLRSSEFLIVICSPNSAKSQWVEREIAFFKTHRDADKVLALIVDGEPGSADAECFPLALTHGVSSDLTIGNSLADAPLAADARITGDGKRGAKLKIAAAVLGVGLDELVNRDERRRTIRGRIIVAASLALATVMSGLAWVAVQARNEAEFQRNEADGLVEFMLTDLRDKLEPVGRLDALDVVGERALAYYAAQKLGDLDADALGRRARALLLVGEISNLRGESDAALQAFTEAAETTAEQLARDPGNAQRVYDHAQSVFWVGYVAYTRGEMEDAEAQFQEYKRLADRLLALDPDNPEWQMESSYAEGNLGAMLFDAGRYREAEPAFARSLQMVEAVAAGEGYDPGRQIEIGLAVNWLGNTYGRQSKAREALALHEREVFIYEDLLERDPANALARYRLAIALQFVCGAQADSGDLDAALEACDRSLDISAELRALEPENTEWSETAVRGQHSQVENLLNAGRFGESEALLDRSEALLAQLEAIDPNNEFWSGELKLTKLKIRTKLALARNDLQNAARHAEQMVAMVAGSDDTFGEGELASAYLVIGDVRTRQGRAADARQMWETALNSLPSEGILATRHGVLTRLGRSPEAGRVAETLDRRGYRHPAYLRVR